MRFAGCNKQYGSEKMLHGTTLHMMCDENIFPRGSLSCFKCLFRGFLFFSKGFRCDGPMSPQLELPCFDHIYKLKKQRLNRKARKRTRDARQAKARLKPICATSYERSRSVQLARRRKPWMTSRLQHRTLRKRSLDCRVNGTQPCAGEHVSQSVS